MSEKNIKLTIAYKGTNFMGWQKQVSSNTIQERIEEAYYDTFKSPIHLTASGRTDAGVHAFNQVANFHTVIDVYPENIVRALNAKLPQDIKIKNATVVDKDFHARYDAIGKTYLYQIYNHDRSSPFLEDYSYKVTYSLDLAKMQKASLFLLGEHDFSSFMSAGSSTKNFVKNIYDIRIEKKSHLLSIVITGNGFLYNMVRIIAGTLIDIARGRFDPEEILKILNAKDRKIAGHTAKAQGLFLYDVFYEHQSLKNFLQQKNLDTLGTML